MAFLWLQHGAFMIKLKSEENLITLWHEVLSVIPHWSLNVLPSKKLCSRYGMK